MKKNILVAGLLFIAAMAFAGKDLPKDVLDANSALIAIFTPHGAFKEKSIHEEMEKALINFGVNLVHSENRKSDDQEEGISTELINKKVVYTFNYRVTQGASSAIYFLDVRDVNGNMLYRAYKTTPEQLLKKITKDFIEFKEDNPDVDKVQYDRSLIKQSTLSEEQKAAEKKKIEERTMIASDQKVVVKYNYFPKDLDQSKLFYLYISKEEYSQNSNMNNTIVQLMTEEYPFEFSNYHIPSLLPAEVTQMHTEGFKYRLRFQEAGASTVHLISQNQRPGMVTSMYQKLNFILFVENVETGEYYSNGKVGDYYVITKDFIKQVSGKK